MVEWKCSLGICLSLVNGALGMWHHNAIFPSGPLTSSHGEIPTFGTSLLFTLKNYGVTAWVLWTPTTSVVMLRVRAYALLPGCWLLPGVNNPWVPQGSLIPLWRIEFCGS